MLCVRQKVDPSFRCCSLFFLTLCRIRRCDRLRCHSAGAPECKSHHHHFYCTAFHLNLPRFCAKCGAQWIVAENKGFPPQSKPREVTKADPEASNAFGTLLTLFHFD